MIRCAHRTRKTLWTLLAVAGLVATGVVAETADAAATNHKALGNLTSVVQYGNGIKLRGWAYDPDLGSKPVYVRFQIDGTSVGTGYAKYPSPSLTKKHPSYGKNRDFVATFDLKAGKHTVCADAHDYPGRKWVEFGCRSVTVNFDPFGRIDTLTQTPGHLTMTGWAIDPNNEKAALHIGARVDGVSIVGGTANLSRPDVGKAYPAAGPNHGLRITFPISEGSHQICLRVINIGLGSATALSIYCLSRTISFSPSGALTHIYQGRNGTLHVIGHLADPDTSAPITARLTSDGVNVGATFVANASTYSGHGFDAVVKLPTSQYAAATRSICLYGYNAGTYGANRTVDCAAKALNYNPRAALVSAVQTTGGARVAGWAYDPDTSSAINVSITLDGKAVKTFTANGKVGVRPGQSFNVLIPATDGAHTVCVIGLNTLAGTAPSTPSCRTVTLDFDPVGKYESLTRASDAGTLRVRGWAADPDTSKPIKVAISVDGGTPTTVTASVPRTDVTYPYPGMGTAHGFDTTVAASPGEHTVCVQAINVLGGNGDTNLRCRLVIAVHPNPPSAVRSVSATAGYGGAVVRWTPPASDGGAPWTSYTITSSPGGIAVTAGKDDTSATVLGLKPSTTYTFTVVAKNVAGTSAVVKSNATKTLASPPPQTTPAPISTSRYVRNIYGASSSDLATMKKEGATDAHYNPSGHGYLVLLDIGGQDEQRGGVILSAGVRYVSYAALVKDIEAYVDGYASNQRASAPVTIAIGTNNDIDVNKTAGANWANKVVDPVVVYARKYPNILIAGANDIEPGFTAGYSATSSWVSGYLAATNAPFVFNGSADGCSWTTTGAHCNNGWTMSGLYRLAGGASPTRIVNLPQIYNTTMAKQWRYISLTGVKAHSPKINFGGALTEWTACQQAGGCGSLTGNYAWTTLWDQLRAEPALRPSSLPYSTDLRIDR